MYTIIKNPAAFAPYPGTKKLQDFYPSLLCNLNNRLHNIFQYTPVHQETFRYYISRNNNIKQMPVIWVFLPIIIRLSFRKCKITGKLNCYFFL